MLAVAAVAAVAAEPSISVTVSDKHVEAGEAFVLSITLVGGSPDRLELPDIDGADLERRRTVANLSGPLTVELTYRALRAGTITIPPIPVRIGGKEVKSDPITITVRDSAIGSILNSGASPSPSPGRTRSGNHPTLEDVTFLRSSVDVREVYQGQQIVFELSWWHLADGNVSVSAAAPPSEPQFPGFYSVKQGELRTEETSNGFHYNVYHYRWLLYPTQTGEIVIPSCKLRADVIISAGRVYTTELSLATDEIPITVKPLPPRPANFSGAVGQFTFEAAPSEEVHVQGVPFFLLATISGQGNPDAIPQLQIPSMTWAQVTSTDSEVQRLAGGEISKVFRYTITPLKIGTHVFPELEFCYFDTERGEYITKTAGPFTMPVADSPEEQQAMIHSTDISRDVERVRVLSKGILPLDTDVDNLRPRRIPIAVLPVAFLSPPIAYAGFALFLRRRRRFASDTAYSRAYHARRRAHDELARVTNSRGGVESLSRAATNYLADVTNRAEGAITFADAQTLVAQLPVDAATSEKLLKVIRACERHRYAGASLSDAEVSALAHAAEEAIDAMDAVLSRERER